MVTIAQLTQEALRHHQAGRLVEAEALYRRILKFEPRRAEIHGKLGLLCAQKGDFRTAADCFRRALALQPDLAEARYFLGKALGELGDLAAARQCYEEVLAREPNHPEVHYELGNLLHQQGDELQAASQFRRALALAPGYAQAHHNLAVALAGQGDLSAAIASYRRALALAPDYADAHSNLGTALLDQGDLAAAIASYRKAAQLAPDRAAVQRGLGTAYHRQGDGAAAEQSFRRALALDPSDPEAHNDLGVLLAERDEWDAALTCYARALALRPDYAEAVMNIGLVHFYRGDVAAGETAYRRALALDPDLAEAHWNEAVCRLLRGDLERGWPKFEWRWKIKNFAPAQRKFSVPLWRGEEDLAGKTILLHAEQGFGDAIQFCRYVPLVAAKARIVLEVPGPLLRLLETLPAEARIVASGEALPAFDLHCPLMSLPLAFKTSLATIPAAVPYLAADPNQAASWRRRLEARAGLLVGLVWAGERRVSQLQASAVDRRRSLPLERLAALAGIPGVTFVSLQKGEPAAQLRSSAFAPIMLDWMEEMNDFADTAALIETLDLVISVDTAVAHLAGALGKKVWLLNRFDTCWRWLLDREDSPWYPTLRLFRQKAPGDWDGVIARVAADLRELAAAWR